MLDSLARSIFACNFLQCVDVYLRIYHSIDHYDLLQYSNLSRSKFDFESTALVHWSRCWFFIQVRHVSGPNSIRKYLPNSSTAFRRVRLERRMARTVLLIIGMCVFCNHFTRKPCSLMIDALKLPDMSESCLMNTQIFFFFLVSFVIAWTPYAVVAFVSFISPNVISPLGGTLPGKPFICTTLIGRNLRHFLQRSLQNPPSTSFHLYIFSPILSSIIISVGGRRTQLNEPVSNESFQSERLALIF